MDSTQRSLTLLASAVAAVATLSTAHAAPVLSWDYEVTTIFKGNNTFTAGTGTQIENNRQVSWGSGILPVGETELANVVFTSGASRSGITISDEGAGTNDTTVNPNIGVVQTNDLTLAGIGLGAWITHHNNPISTAFATLTTSQIDSSLQLWAIPVGNPRGVADVVPPTVNFTIFFAETPNNPGEGIPCADGNPNDEGLNTNGCSDIFALNASQVLNQTFDWAGLTYFVSIFPIIGDGLGSFTQLTNQACLAAGANTGCLGFQTIEAQDTTVRFGFSITTDPVQIPEPGTLALLGGALLGLAGFRRRATR